MYARTELLGLTVFDIGIWDDPSERARMFEEIRRHGRVRNRITRLRKRSGEAIDTFYSADIMAIEGRDGSWLFPKICRSAGNSACHPPAGQSCPPTPCTSSGPNDLWAERCVI